MMTSSTSATETGYGVNLEKLAAILWTLTPGEQAKLAEMLDKLNDQRYP